MRTESALSSLQSRKQSRLLPLVGQEERPSCAGSPLDELSGIDHAPLAISCREWRRCAPSAAASVAACWGCDAVPDIMATLQSVSQQWQECGANEDTLLWGNDCMEETE